MTKVENYLARWNVIGRIWAMSLTRRLVALSGVALIIIGYGLILNPPETVDLETITRHAVSGMVLVFCGGVIEVLVLLGWSRR